MEWEETAEGVLATLCRMVPDTIRELAKAAARDEAELVASERESATVRVDDVIRGFVVPSASIATRMAQNTAASAPSTRVIGTSRLGRSGIGSSWIVKLRGGR